jgi:hypothetical protein
MALARPTPYSWSVGDVATVNLLNSIRDALNWSQQPPVFIGTQSVAQSIGNANWIALSLDTAQVDTYNGHSTTTNSSRYTPQQPGWYVAAGVAAIALNANGARAARLQQNGAPIKGAGGMTSPATGSNDCAIVTPTRPIYCNGTSDYIEVAGWQGSGGALNSATDADLSSSLAVWWLHV